MNVPLRLICAVLAGLLLCSVTNHAQQAAPAGASQILDVPGGKIRVVTVAAGLFHPWSLAFLPDGSVLVAERDGKLRIIRNGVLAPEPVWTSPTPRGQAADSLHGLAVHPLFAQNRLVYVSYPKNGPKGNTLAISRGRLQGSTLTEVADIFVADAWETSGNLAGHMMFGPDNTLYVMVGDRDRLCCTGVEDNSLRMKAQALDNHVGKTLRIADDGGVPPDNPFVGKAGAKPEIFTYGHRNGYGLAFHPQTGELWQAEIGPMGGDEVNIPPARPQLRLAARVDRTELHRHARLRSTVGATGHGQPADSLGAVDQPLEHHVLHGRPVPEMEEQPVRGGADDADAAAGLIQSTIAGRAA
jgi:glucose/arabinose dehydrogenase